MTKRDVNLTADDLVKRYGETMPLMATLTELDGTPIPDKELIFTINGVPYGRNTDENGVARLNINLIPGSYTCSIGYRGDTEHNYNLIYADVTIQKQDTTLITSNFTKTYGDGKALTVSLYETVTTGPVAGKDVLFTINGIVYTRKTDVEGVAKLNINLRKGEYRCVVDSPEDNIHNSTQSNLIVKVKTDTFMDGTNITKMEDELVVYQCAVYDPWERVDCDVVITVNGVSYNRHTEGDGLARLNVRLPAGEYLIKAEFLGDEFNNPSSVVNTVTSKRYAQELSTRRSGVFYPADNIGFVESHVMVKQWGPDAGKAKKVIFWDDSDAMFHKDISFTSYEITETDPRVKTAKFTTREYFDLTAGQCWAYISSPYHENFGGKILKVDYDKDKKLYTYQCQDGRRNYMSKGRLIIEDCTIYHILEAALIMPAESSFTIPISDEHRIKHSKLLSGLRPLEAYNLEQKSAVASIKQNAYEAKPAESLAYDSDMDKIMNFSHYSGTPVDVYFTPEGVCQIEPMNWDVWMKTGFKITHSDLASYKYGFDTTNILTGVSVQTPQKDFGGLKQENGKLFNETVEELSYFFGGNIGMISPVTKQVETESSEEGSSDSGSSSGSSSSTATGSNKGKTVVVGCDQNNGNDWAIQDAVVAKLRSAGYTVEELPVDSNAFANYDWNRSAKGKVGVYLMASSTISIADAMSSPGHGFDYYVFANRDNELGRRSIKEWDTARWGRDNDCNSVCNGWAGLTSAQIVEKMGNRGTMVWGNTNEEMANAVLAAVNGEPLNKGSPTGAASTNSDSGENKSTTTVVDEVATLDKAMSEVSKSVRDLLSFEIKLPLNHSMFKELHTNQWLWTELPTEFKLGNLSRIFYLMKAWKQNRGVEYMVNRWYIEKVVTKMDSNGLFATLTLNPFPSSYSVYSDALRSYRDAYDQAYRQKEEQKTDSSSSSSGGVGEARLGSDSEYTGDMACATGRYHGHAGDNENFDNCAKKGYAQQGRKYFEWARQYNSPIELAKALANRFEYEGYSENEDANAEVTHNNGGTIYCNCYDAARLVKCCFDACGFDCIVVTGSIYKGGHGWNAVKHNGRWYTFDLCYEYTSRGDWGGTNTLRMADEW